MIESVGPPGGQRVAGDTVRVEGKAIKVEGAWVLPDTRMSMPVILRIENIEYGATNEEIIENPSGTHLTARFARAAAEPSMGSPAGSDRVIQL